MARMLLFGVGESYARSLETLRNVSESLAFDYFLTYVTNKSTMQDISFKVLVKMLFFQKQET